MLNRRRGLGRLGRGMPSKIFIRELEWSKLKHAAPVQAGTALGTFQRPSWLAHGHTGKTKNRLAGLQCAASAVSAMTAALGLLVRLAPGTLGQHLETQRAIEAPTPAEQQ